MERWCLPASKADPGQEDSRLRRRLWRGLPGKQVLQQQVGSAQDTLRLGEEGGLSPVASMYCPFTSCRALG